MTSDRIARLHIQLEDIEPAIWRRVEGRGGRRCRPHGDYPRLIDGARRAPPEDVGGLPGLEGFLMVVADPADPEHENIMTWYGRPFEPDDISLAIINERLGKLARRRAVGKAAFEKNRNRIN